MTTYLNPIHLLRRLLFLIRNVWKRRHRHLDYILFNLSDSPPALPEARPWLRRQILGEPPLSLNDLDKAFRQISHDKRIKGVILNLNNASMPLADLQSFRHSLLQLREHNKAIICYAQQYDMASYYIASLADKIFLQPGGDLMTLGLRIEATFLKELLNFAGVEFEAVAISPYKTAYDQFSHSSPSPEFNEQMNWLLDSRFQMIVGDIATSRGITPQQVTTMIDQSPLVDDEAAQGHYVDAVIHEEQLPQQLNTEHILDWDDARNKVFKLWRKPAKKYIALLPIVGVIIPGESRQPPVDLPIPFIGGEFAGDETIVQHIRALMDDDSIAATILFIDSPGGAAIAAEAMTAALDELAKQHPIVAYMNNVAASGGYYVATPARCIVAQPGTITGSIGVITGKPNTKKLFEQLQINRVDYSRGENIGLLSDTHPYTNAQREKQRQIIEHAYDQFVQRVAKSRSMTPEAVRAVGDGRVWTGQQASENGLVDELGGLYTALEKARELAKAPEDTPLVMPSYKGDYLPPMAAQPQETLKHLYHGTHLLFNNRPQYLMPFSLTGL